LSSGTKPAVARAAARKTRTDWMKKDSIMKIRLRELVWRELMKVKYAPRMKDPIDTSVVANAYFWLSGREAVDRARMTVFPMVVYLDQSRFLGQVVVNDHNESCPQMYGIRLTSLHSHEHTPVVETGTIE
jgi:hypothetical protein